MSKYKILIFVLVLLAGFFLRFYKLDNIPIGLYTDEAALGYDAYSLMLTGKDQYGKQFPIFLRSFGDFKSPLYAYLTIVPIYFFGLSAFSARLISSLSGTLLIIISFLLIPDVKKKNYLLALISSILIMLSPWGILFSRHALEANLALLLLASSILLFKLSLKSNNLFVLASIMLGTSTYAYHSERFFSYIFLICFIFMFKKKLSKKFLFSGTIIFFLLQIPQLILIQTPAFNVRIDQVNYWTNDFFIHNGGRLIGIPLGKELFIVREFLSQYLAYFSPKNLFFQPDSQSIRSMPDLSIFYSWMFIPFLFGLKELLLLRKDTDFKVIILTILVAPIPAALTKDPFYTIRALSLFWGFTFIIALGIINIVNLLPKLYKITIPAIFLIISLTSLYSSYFVLLKYERSNDYGYPFIELVKKTEELNSKEFLIDTGRVSNAYIYFAFYKKYNPLKFQKDNVEVLNNYYKNIQLEEIHKMDNVTIKHIVWNKDLDKKGILVGDTLAISEKQAKEHNLTPEFEIKDLYNNVFFKAYLTHPELNKRM